MCRRALPRVTRRESTTPKNNVRVVRDFDSHGWVQVFFPGYGWIDFEPTPRWPEHERQFVTAREALALSATGGTDGIADPSEFLDPFDDIGGPGLTRINSGATFGSDFLANVDIVAIGIRTGIFAGAAAAVWLLLYVIWNLGLRGLSTVERAYARMNRLGTLAGLRRRAYQTPNEYAAMVAGALGESGAGAQSIGREFAVLRYTGGARRDTADDNDGSDDTDEMEQAWRSIRGALIARAFRRLLPGGSQG